MKRVIFSSIVTAALMASSIGASSALAQSSKAAKAPRQICLQNTTSGVIRYIHDHLNEKRLTTIDRC